AGLDATSYGLICQELERGDSGLRSFISVQGNLCMFPISSYGSDEQKQRYLPGMQRGDIIGCFGLTEPDHGSDPGGMETRAVRDGDGSWVLNGAKMWITNGNLADVAVVWAKYRMAMRRWCTASWSRPTVPGSPRTRCTISCRCGPLSPQSS